MLGLVTMVAALAALVVAAVLLLHRGEPSWLRRLARASIESVRTIQGVD